MSALNLPPISVHAWRRRPPLRLSVTEKLHWNWAQRGQAADAELGRDGSTVDGDAVRSHDAGAVAADVAREGPALSRSRASQ